MAERRATGRGVRVQLTHARSGFRDAFVFGSRWSSPVETIGARQQLVERAQPLGSPAWHLLCGAADGGDHDRGIARDFSGRAPRRAKMSLWLSLTIPCERDGRH